MEVKIDKIYMNNNTYNRLIEGEIFDKINTITENLCPIFGIFVLLDKNLNDDELRLEWTDQNNNIIRI